jgi:hypothetical protein
VRVEDAMASDGGRSHDEAAQRNDAPQDPERARATDERTRESAESLTEDELRGMAGGTKPTEDEPFLPG